jgi:hypothetical protein
MDIGVNLLLDHAVICPPAKRTQKRSGRSTLHGKCRFVGRRLALSPLAIIVAMTFWSWAWGIAGALRAVPITASMVIVCNHFERSR